MGVRHARSATVTTIVLLAMVVTGCGRGADPEVRAGTGTAAASDAERVPDPSNPLVRLRQHASDGAGAAGLLEGSPTEELVYTPVVPCRIVDTRVGTAAGGDLAANETRSFYVTDLATPSQTAQAFAAQGGKTTGCGLPFGVATSVMVNFTIVAAKDTGYLRAWATGTPPPTATLVNFNPSLNVSNGIAVPICDPYTSNCTKELTTKSFLASSHLVIEVVGYFGFSLPPIVVTPDTSTASADVNLPSPALACTVYLNIGAAPPQVEPLWAGNITVDGQATITVAHTTGTEDRLNLTVGYERRINFVTQFSPSCGQEPCTAATGTPAVVSAAEPTGTYSLTVPVRCDIPVDLDSAALNELLYRLYLAGNHVGGGAITVDRLSYTATFTADWTAG